MSVLLIVFSVVVRIVTSDFSFAVLFVFYFIVLVGVKIFVEFREHVGNAFPRCFDVSRFVSHMRDENFLFSCLDARVQSLSFEFFKNSL